MNAAQINEILGKNIKKRIKALGYTQNELAELCGMNKTKMSYKIRNLQKFSFYEILLISDELLTPINELLEGANL